MLQVTRSTVLQTWYLLITSTYSWACNPQCLFWSLSIMDNQIVVQKLYISHLQYGFFLISWGKKKLYSAHFGFPKPSLYSTSLAIIISLHNLHPFSVLQNFNNNTVPMWHQSKIRSSFYSLLIHTHGSSKTEKATEGKDSKQKLQNK